jgi:hypothetical protein
MVLSDRHRGKKELPDLAAKYTVESEVWRFQVKAA